MKYLQSILVIIILITASSCRKDFTTIESFGSLQFSTDTLFLDTVFTNIGSATYTLKVYNRSSKDITVPEIKLENSNSNYRLNVDGIPGQNFEDIDILANDSIFVFIETTIDFSTIPDPLYTDRILFDNGNNQQDVDLVTLVQDAIFIFPDRDATTMDIENITIDNTTLQGRFLTDDELTFTNEKSYVIYGYAAVPANKTLIIEAGTQVYFHDQSGLIIDKDASLLVNGTLDEKVVFEGDRLDNFFSTIPGQWGRIWLRAGSKNNEINHALIKNGTIGILVDSIGSISSPTLKIQNSEIYNNSSYGILGRATNIEANNIVIGNSGISSFAGISGGTYNFTHATFANYWNGLRSSPAVLINNIPSSENNEDSAIFETNDLNEANFSNCIIEGNNNIEFILNNNEDNSIFNYNINNSLIKFRDLNNSFSNSSELNFENLNHYQNNLLNLSPDFKNTSQNNFTIGESSDAINQATNSPVILDLLGVNRSTSPDIGAYQHIIFEETLIPTSAKP